MTYKIIDDTKEFTPKGNILLIALMDEQNEIHVCMNKQIDYLLKDKTRLYELITEKFNNKEGVKFQNYMCLIVNKDDFKKEIIQ